MYWLDAIGIGTNVYPDPAKINAEAGRYWHEPFRKHGHEKDGRYQNAVLGLGTVCLPLVPGSGRDPKEKPAGKRWRAPNPYFRMEKLPLGGGYRPRGRTKPG